MAIPIPAKHIEEFENMGFGLFVHWGLYSLLGKGEWVYKLHNLKMKDYEKLINTFTAEDFDAEELCITAKRAGCKYITFTTRHHEGFSLYDTCGLSEFDSVHSPAGRDLVREFTEACNKHGIMPMFYHTTLDWHNSDYINNFQKYLKYLRESVEILCTNYGKIGGFWFDGNWDRENEDWREDELYAVIRKHQREAIIVNNTGLVHRGAVGNPEIDSVTFEQGKPTPMNREGMKKYLAAEMCHTINDHWGIGNMDFNLKSPRELIECLCDCRRAGANYLLNIGPTAQGGIEPLQRELLLVIGKWMDIYGEAIYKGKPTAACGSGRNFVLKGDGALYLFFFDHGRMGDGNVTVDGNYCGGYCFRGVTDEISRVVWMDNNEELSFFKRGNLLTVDASGYPYGMSTCVRVAKAEIKK